MNLILLIYTLINLITLIKRIFDIRSYREIIDKECKKNKLITNKYKNIFAINMILFTSIPLIYLLLCATFVNNFIFTLICFINGLWTIFDTLNICAYLKSNKTSKTFNSKLYRILSKPFDLGFSLYMLYMIFIQ